MNQPTAPDTRRFHVHRDTTRPGATDEDRAMAHVNYGPFTGYEAARAGLLRAIATEFGELEGERHDRDWTARLRLASLAAGFAAAPEATETELDGLCFWLHTND